MSETKSTESETHGLPQSIAMAARAFMATGGWWTKDRVDAFLKLLVAVVAYLRPAPAAPESAATGLEKCHTLACPDPCAMPEGHGVRSWFCAACSADIISKSPGVVAPGVCTSASVPLPDDAMLRAQLQSQAQRLELDAARACIDRTPCTACGAPLGSSLGQREQASDGRWFCASCFDAGRYEDPPPWAPSYVGGASDDAPDDEAAVRALRQELRFLSRVREAAALVIEAARLPIYEGHGGPGGDLLTVAPEALRGRLQRLETALGTACTALGAQLIDDGETGPRAPTCEVPYQVDRSVRVLLEELEAGHGSITGEPKVHMAVGALRRVTGRRRSIAIHAFGTGTPQS